jgi:hypothetical protein
MTFINSKVKWGYRIEKDAWIVQLELPIGNQPTEAVRFVAKSTAQFIAKFFNALIISPEG